MEEVEEPVEQVEQIIMEVLEVEAAAVAVPVGVMLVALATLEQAVHRVVQPRNKLLVVIHGIMYIMLLTL